jgi:hypothetical protein
MTEAWKAPIIRFRTNQADERANDNHNDLYETNIIIKQKISRRWKNGYRIRDKSSWMMKRHKNVKQGKNVDDGSKSTCRKDECKNYRNLHGIGSPKFSQKDRNRHRVEQ